MPSESNTLSGRLAAMLQALRASPRVKVFEETEKMLAPENATLDTVIANLAEFADVSAHESFRSCWMSFERLSVHWESVDQAAEERETVGGEASLVYLFDLASRGTDLVTEQASEKERELLRSLRVVDDQPAGGNGTFAAVRLVDRKLMPDVWFLDIRTGIHALDVNYCDYLDALITTKGGYGWQYLYADIDLTKPEQRMVRERLTNLLAFLTSAFPDVDYSALQERFDARTARRARGRH